MSSLKHSVGARIIDEVKWQVMSFKTFHDIFWTAPSIVIHKKSALTNIWNVEATLSRENFRTET